MTTTLVKNGTVITASDHYDADIYIDKGYSPEDAAVLVGIQSKDEE